MFGNVVVKNVSSSGVHWVPSVCDWDTHYYY